MPSTRLLDVKVKSLPCFEQEGMIWIWPGSDPPAASLPSLQPPPGFQVHAEVWFLDTLNFCKRWKVGKLCLCDLLINMSSHKRNALHKIDCDGTSSGTRPTSGQPFRSRTRPFYSHIHLCQGVDRSKVCSFNFYCWTGTKYPSRCWKDYIN